MSNPRISDILPANSPSVTPNRLKMGPIPQTTYSTPHPQNPDSFKEAKLVPGIQVKNLLPNPYNPYTPYTLDSLFQHTTQAAVLEDIQHT